MCKLYKAKQSEFHGYKSVIIYICFCTNVSLDVYICVSVSFIFSLLFLLDVFELEDVNAHQSATVRANRLIIKEALQTCGLNHILPSASKDTDNLSSELDFSVFQNITNFTP